MAMTLRTREQQATFDAIVVEATELRPLPVIAVRLLEMAANERFSAQDLALTIGTDQALTAKILRMANSSFYGMPKRATSVRNAVVLLGFRQVRALALAACMIDAGGSVDQGVMDYEQFWRNSLIVGMFAQILAEADGQEREVAFTAGVLHNIGRLSLAQRRTKAFDALARFARSTAQPMDEVERMHLGFSDADLGAAIARRWAFPEVLCDAVAHHAAPPDSIPSPHDLDSIVARARRIARACGISDTVDLPAPGTPELEWEEPRVARLLARAGGLEGVLEWSDSFLEYSAAA